MSTFAIPNENGVAVKAASSLKLLTLEFLLKNFSKKKFQKICGLKNKAYLCIPVEKTGPRKRV